MNAIAYNNAIYLEYLGLFIIKHIMRSDIAIFAEDFMQVINDSRAMYLLHRFCSENFRDIEMQRDATLISMKRIAMAGQI